MISWFILGLCVLAAVLLTGRWLMTTDPRTLARAIKWGGLGALVVIGLYLVLTGRFAFLLPLALFLLPVLRRLRRRGFGAYGRAPSAGQSSHVTTDFIEMTLDHDTGAVNGRVLQGRFEGRKLEELSLDELLALHEECRHADAEAATLLETYLDRIHPDAWREQAEAAGGGAAARGAPMTRDEAYEILGLDPEASETEIREAHHRLMLKNHPDKGGSTYLATKINQAKELLLGT